MGDKQDAARVTWATIKLTQVGQRPVSLDQLATPRRTASGGNRTVAAADLAGAARPPRRHGPAGCHTLRPTPLARSTP
jgi:hypothetical protein